MGTKAVQLCASTALAAALCLVPVTVTPSVALDAAGGQFVSSRLRTAPVAHLRFVDLRVAQSSYQKVKTTGYVALYTSKTKSSFPATLSFNPYGSAASTGKSQSKTLTLKWSPTHKAYRSTFTFFAKAPGALQVVTKANGKVVSTSRKPSRPHAMISGFKPGTTYISPGSRAGAYVTVNPAYGRKVHVDRLVKGRWVREQSITTDKNTRSDKILIWFKVPKGRTLNNYRVYAPETIQSHRSAFLRHSIGLRTSSVSAD